MLIAHHIKMRDANAFITDNHRHHKPVRGLIFAIAAYDTDRWQYQEEGLVGVAIVGRPVSRMLDNGETAEVTRLCTDGTPNAPSFLYSRCAAACKAIGFQKVVTYILDSESGTSLKAAGWTYEGYAGGGSWSRPSRKRTVTATAQTSLKKRYSKNFESNMPKRHGVCCYFDCDCDNTDCFDCSGPERGV